MKLKELQDIIQSEIAKIKHLQEQEDDIDEDIPQDELPDDELPEEDPQDLDTPPEESEPESLTLPSTPEPEPELEPESEPEPEPEVEPKDTNITKPTRLPTPEPTPSGFIRISKDEATTLIKSTKGKFFTASFTKKDGTNRIMNARLGVKVYLRGGSLPYDPASKGLIPVYDIQAKAYRMVNLNTLNGLKIGSSKYVVS